MTASNTFLIRAASQPFTAASIPGKIKDKDFEIQKANITKHFKKLVGFEPAVVFNDYGSPSAAFKEEPYSILETMFKKYGPPMVAVLDAKRGAFREDMGWWRVDGLLHMVAANYKDSPGGFKGGKTIVSARDRSYGWDLQEVPDLSVFKKAKFNKA